MPKIIQSGGGGFQARGPVKLRPSGGFKMEEHALGERKFRGGGRGGFRGGRGRGRGRGGREFVGRGGREFVGRGGREFRGRGNTEFRGRGRGFRGSRGGKNFRGRDLKRRDSKGEPDESKLDSEMNKYWKGDDEVVNTHLDADMDEYWNTNPPINPEQEENKEDNHLANQQGDIEITQ